MSRNLASFILPYNREARGNRYEFLSKKKYFYTHRILIPTACARFSTSVFCITRGATDVPSRTWKEERGQGQEGGREKERKERPVSGEGRKDRGGEILAPLNWNAGAVRTFELLREYYSYFIRRGRRERKISTALCSGSPEREKPPAPTDSARNSLGERERPVSPSKKLRLLRNSVCPCIDVSGGAKVEGMYMN